MDINRKPVPPRMVFVQKPEKRKARLVVCGQFLDPECDTGTSNIDAAPLRALIASGWKKGNTIAGMDVAAAFLQADLPKERAIVIHPLLR